MAIVKMSRFSVTAFQAEKGRLLRALQEMDEVSFRDLPSGFEEEELAEGILKNDRATATLSAIQTELLQVENAIRDLSRELPEPGMLEKLNNALPVISYAELEESGNTDVSEITEAVRGQNDALAETREEIRALREERRRLRPYLDLDVSMGELKKLKSVRVAVGSLPKRWLDELRREIADVDRVELEVLSTGDRYSYIIVFYEAGTEVEEALHRNAFTAEEMPEGQTPAEWTAEAADRIEILDARIKRIEAHLKELALTHLDALKTRAEALRQAEARELARAKLVSGDFVFLMEGYFPAEREEEFRTKLEAVLKQPYDLEIRVIERDEKDLEDVPIMLRNNKLAAPFQSIVETYSLPKYNETDPTPLLLPWYAMCFGLMMGDLGYGLIMWILSFAALKFFRLKEGMRINLAFFHILSYPCMLAGLAYGSFFGFPIFEKPLLVMATTDMTAPRIVDLTGNSSMDVMILSILFGLLMLFTGLGIKGYLYVRDGDLKGLVFDVLCWFMAVGGALLMLFGADIGLPAVGVLAAKVVMILGMIGIVLFSARAEKSKAARFAWGAYNLYGISSWIGDLVSYTRIAALAMAGGFIGYAVNLISGMLFSSGILASLFGVLVLVIFHAFNLFLSGLSGYVHSLRLIYVEFFGKFYEGGGKAFKKFRPEGKYLDVR